MNGFTAADMTTAAAKGHAEGYQAGYSDAVKAYEVGKPAAAQEAVAYWLAVDAEGLVQFGLTTDDANGGEASRDQVNDWINSELNVEGPLHLVGAYASAPVAAAPVDLDAHGLRALDNCIRDLRRLLELANDYALDEMQIQSLLTAIDSMELRKRGALSAAPEGGTQLGYTLADVHDAYSRGKDAATPAAPGIDLEQFREAVEAQYSAGMEQWCGGAEEKQYLTEHRDRLLALIDASPNGGNDEANIPAPHRECYSDDGYDSWYEHPADAELVYGLKVGDTYTLIVSHCSVERTYRVTKAPDEASDDYEVEPVQPTSAEVGS